MNKSSFKYKIRLLETYSLTQGILLALLAAWLRFGLQVVKMEVPPDAASAQQSVNLFAYGLLSFMLIAFFALLFVKAKLRNEILRNNGNAGPESL